MTHFTKVPIQTPACGVAGIANAKDGVVDSGDCRKSLRPRFVGSNGGDVSFRRQVKNRSNAQNVNQENTNRAEEEDGKARAPGVGEVNLRFGLSLVCGLFVHGRSLARDRRFNRRKSRCIGTLRARERRGFKRRGLFRERAGSFWVPEFPIPEIESFEGFGPKAQDFDWTVDGDESWWKEAFIGQPLGRAAAEEVNDEKDRCPETPAREAEARGTGGVSSGFDLVCGLFVHGESVKREA